MKSEKATKLLTRTQQARRADIIAAAITVINREGYANATVQRVAEEAGTSKSTVLYHFRSKTEIEKALVGSIFEDGAAYMGPFIVKAQTYREKLQAYLSSNLQFIADNVAAIAALHEIERNIGHQNFTESSARMQNDAPTQWLQDLLVAGQESGEFTDFDATTLAASIRLIIDGSSHYILRHPSLDIAHYIAETIRLFDTAVTTRRKEPLPPT